MSYLKYLILYRIWVILNFFFNYKSFYQYRVEKGVKIFGKKLKVNNRCIWFGKNVVLGDYVNLNRMRVIGKGAVVGSGAVLTKNLPPFAVVGGNPANILKSRDKNLFYKLKMEKKFL